ncbi:MAG: ferrous iron transport protein A [Nodosilinea sp.]
MCYAFSPGSGAGSLQVVSLSGQPVEIQHLHHLGFCPGTEFQVISRRLSGSVVVLLGESRLGLGARMAKQVIVAKA